MPADGLQVGRDEGGAVGDWRPPFAFGGEIEEGKGKRVDDFDLIIAATALLLNYSLVTNNEKRFNAIPGLRIENWSRG